MQPVRVIIAAIFFVIGALLVIPALNLGGDNTSSASNTPAAATPTTTTPTAPTTAPTTAKTTAKPTTTSPRPTATRTTAPPVVTTPTQTPTPTPTVTATRPTAVPLTITFGKVVCPGRKVSVKVVNDGPTTQGYSITRNGSNVLADQLGPNASRTSSVTVPEDRTSVVRVAQDGRSKASRSYKANCARSTAKPSPTADPTRRTLPRTGSDENVAFAQIATGVGSLITGAIILWWGGLWPSRRDGMFRSSDRG